MLATNSRFKEKLWGGKRPKAGRPPQYPAGKCRSISIALCDTDLRIINKAEGKNRSDKLKHILTEWLRLKGLTENIEIKQRTDAQIIEMMEEV